MKRILTASVLIGLLLGTLWLPPVAFTAFIALVALLGWNEYSRMAASLNSRPAAAPGGVLAVLLAASFASSSPAAVPVVLILAVLLLALATLRDHYADPRGLTAGLAFGLGGLLWIGLLLGCQVGIRDMEQGRTWLLLLYATVAIGDSAAFYGGKSVGRHKLAPHLSPNKTVEGTVFGLLGSAATAAVMTTWLPELTLPRALALGLVLGALGQAGDLIESSLKRAAGTKDSSNLLPGHGGVLDRIDAHLTAGAFLYAALLAGWLV